MSIPYLRKYNGKSVFMVDDKPFILLSGELRNSASATASSLEASLQKAVALGMNSVIASVSWELIEPEEAIKTEAVFVPNPDIDPDYSGELS